VAALGGEVTTKAATAIARPSVEDLQKW
jgi:hypothetical protein